MRELKSWAARRPHLALLNNMISDLERANGGARNFFRWRLIGYLNALWDNKLITDEQWDLFGLEVGHA